MADMAHADDHEPTWQTCVRCGELVHLNFVDYELDEHGEPNYEKPYHADGCAKPHKDD